VALFVLVIVCFSVAGRSGRGTGDMVEAAGQPSPTLGATATPKPNPPGVQDSDPNDYGHAIWVVVAVAVVAVIVGAGTLWLVKSRRVDMNPLSREDDPSSAESSNARDSGRDGSRERS
jgi:hypothetical protein